MVLEMRLLPATAHSVCCNLQYARLLASVVWGLHLNKFGLNMERLRLEER